MKITINENFRIIVLPDFAYLPTSFDVKQCNNMIAEIKRHVDGVKSAEIEYDPVERCSFCMSTWEVNQDPNDPDVYFGEPICCDKAQQEFRAQKKGYSLMEVK